MPTTERVNYTQRSYMFFFSTSSKKKRHVIETPAPTLHAINLEDSVCVDLFNAGTRRDCSRESAHGLQGQRSQVYRAIGNWLLTGEAPQELR